MTNTNKPECNVIGWLDPSFAHKVVQFCAAHDAAYHQATENAKAGLPRGSRIAADLAWIKGAATVSRLKAYFYGAFLLAGSWWLWYDCDRKLEKLLGA